MTARKDILFVTTPLGTTITPTNALGARVAKINFPGISDFSQLGVPVEVKMPVDICKSLVRGRGATFGEVKAVA